MRILFVTQWFQPEPTFKGLAFAKALQALGHEVEVVTGFPNYPGGKVYPGYRVQSFQKEIMDGIPVYRGYLYPSHDRSALRRVANYVSFAISSSVLALTRRRPDVVYVYTPPMTAALAPVLLRIFRGVPFVPDIQDLWPDTLTATGMIDNPRLLRLVGIWTNFVFRRAARIIVLSDGFRHRLMERGIRTPVAVIPNWAPQEIIQVAASLPALAQDEGNQPFTVVFAGNMGKAQGLGTVLEAAALLRDENVRFLMVGGGIEVDALRTRATAMSLDNVEFGASRRPEALGEVFAQADALLVHLRDDPLFAITIPSKTQAYMAIGKPILMGVRGDAARMLEDAGAGTTFDPENPPALARAIRSMKSASVAERAQMGEAGSRFYRERLSFEIGAAAIARELESAAGVGKNPAA